MIKLANGIKVAFTGGDTIDGVTSSYGSKPLYPMPADEHAAWVNKLTNAANVPGLNVSILDEMGDEVVGQAMTRKEKLKALAKFKLKMEADKESFWPRNYIWDVSAHHKDLGLEEDDIAGAYDVINEAIG